MLFVPILFVDTLKFLLSHENVLRSLHIIIILDFNVSLAYLTLFCNLKQNLLLETHNA